jgi:nicotinamidase-related amidase
MTNVCCEASARDAMAAGFKTIVAQFIGDVRSTDELIELLR